MRTFRALAVTIALLAFAPAAQAQVFDLSKATCKEFIESGKDLIIVAWLNGYFADLDADPVVDFGELAKIAQKLTDYCKANPTVDIITAAEPIYEKK